MGENRGQDVVICSRVRLARNFADLPFPGAMHGDDGAKAQLRATAALSHAPEGRDYALMRMNDLSNAQRGSLVEQHLVTKELLSGGEFAAVLLRRDESVSVMINEDDHLSIHAQLAGCRLEEAAAEAFAVDDVIGREVRYAYDAELGFLTSCPTNTGTGMRASLLLHLPALTRTNQVGQAMQELVKIGLSLRPLYSEEGEAQGELFLLSNQVALGRSEEDLIDSVEAVVDQLVERERKAREYLLLANDSLLEDRLMRSLGVLRYARRLSEAEWIRRWSDVRLAIQAGMLRMELSALDALLDLIKPAHLEMSAGHTLSPDEREEMRAKVVREALA